MHIQELAQNPWVRIAALALLLLLLVACYCLGKNYGKKTGLQTQRKRSAKRQCEKQQEPKSVVVIVPPGWIATTAPAQEVP
ncbi:MAG: hypothetical protein KVP17_000700 [Porospora cf. gigantea B]|uniref:uncharacterized protein n=1 Tax=Porospora cf. gigantea B TaxID=2853592 RepID=UPI003571A298|nr:MAG: hypothetical protein KVP17_000700 [Porospora cf. gigantea B]